VLNVAEEENEWNLYFSRTITIAQDSVVVFYNNDDNNSNNK
jgi:hypothetical protein